MEYSPPVLHLRNVFAKTGVTSRGELAHLTLS